jgi:eukaryotic-like serine/threonine-protein kinase
MAGEPNPAPRAIGRYVLFREIAHGGMATVHLGRLRGPSGFSRTVAIKRLHPQFARDPEFVSMFLDEARLAARVQHPHVVDVLDVVAVEGELFLVMDYVHGESLAKLLVMSRELDVPVLPRIVTAIATNLLDGLHAAHEARNERGDPLGIVHRDVSPQNVMVGADGVARVLDFGIAKASELAHGTTGEGQMKGKVPYMAPEQVGGATLDRRTDVYAASVVIWEALTGKRFMPAGDMIATAQLILTREHQPPSAVHPGVPPELDAVILKGLARDPADRWPTARDMAGALERAWPVGSSRDVSEWVKRVAGAPLAERAGAIAEIESSVLPAMTRSDPPRSGSVRIAAPKAAPPAPDETPGTLETAPGAPRRNPTVWVAIAGGGAIGGLLVVVLIAASGSKGSGTPAVGGPVPETSAAVSPAAPASAESPPASASVSIPVPEPQPSTSAVEPPRRLPPSPVPARPPVKAGCNPPYTIDANGVRVPKRQCF